MIQYWLTRILLSPFSLLYAVGIALRNSLYDTKLLRSISFSVPVISVGNLSIGGAGKTPHVEYLIEILAPYINVAVLSRGYKRKSKGFRIINTQDQVSDSGDEPLQYKRKYQDIAVAVSESRATGIPELIKFFPAAQCVLLDDAFQHRSVQPGLNILLTEYELPYTQDYLLPVGRLRETRSGAQRADVIVISKCPATISSELRAEMVKAIAPQGHQIVLFSKYKYFRPYALFSPSERITLNEDTVVLLLCAIAASEYLESYISEQVSEVITYKFEDHHYFTDRDLSTLQRSFDNRTEQTKIILTTEKDSVRLWEHRSFIQQHRLPIYVLPIKVDFMDHDGDIFDKLVKDYLLNMKV